MPGCLLGVRSYPEVGGALVQWVDLDVDHSVGSFTVAHTSAGLTSDDWLFNGFRYRVLVEALLSIKMAGKAWKAFDRLIVAAAYFLAGCDLSEEL